jgi:hypothetical protein
VGSGVGGVGCFVGVGVVVRMGVVCVGFVCWICVVLFGSVTVSVGGCGGFGRGWGAVLFGGEWGCVWVVGLVGGFGLCWVGCVGWCDVMVWCD